jgi:hypothetical protein
MVATAVQHPILTRLPAAYQRLRDAIDSRIAEEQARQKSAQDNISRSNSARRPPNSNLSPGQRSRPRRNTGTPVRGPDPKEFEAEFAIGDDEDSSRSATPRLETPEDVSETTTLAETEHGEDGEKGKTKAPVDTPGKENASTAEKGPTSQPTIELPAEVRGKLRRLDKLEVRYHGMDCCYPSCDGAGEGRIANWVLFYRTPQGIPRGAFACPLDRTIRSCSTRKHPPHVDRRAEGLHRVSQSDVAEERHGYR